MKPKQSQLELDTDADPAQLGRRLAYAASAAAAEGHLDELRDGAALRPGWARFFGLLGPRGLADAATRAQQIEQQVALNGITHNVYAEQAGVAGVAAGADRPWPLHALPFLIEARDWAAIEAGTIQRASLLQAMLADCYGPQRLLRDGLLPAALVHGHPGYLHTLHGATPAAGTRLHVVGFDLGRGADGRWSVLSQRLQAPSGLGYVLENRLIVSKLFPEPFRELRVQHLALAYRQLIDTLMAQAAPIAEAAGDPAPRLVLLTPGPFNETYFEHTFLARYLGLPLVEGSDLTVRGDRLYLKTVQGLQPVHGLLRRLDDAWCDPLELLAESTLGVPGLLQVIRAQQVVIANALGAGFLESPALHGFMPAIAQALFGEELRLGSLPTWWCGEAAAWHEAQAGFDDSVLRPTHGGADPGGPDEAVIVATLGGVARARLRDRVEARPQAYALQRFLPFSQTPVLEHGRLQPHSAVLRVYAIADGRGGWRVLPGGLTRVATRDAHFVSMQRGGASLDTWVLSEGEVDTWSMLPEKLRPASLAAFRSPVASRTGENLFWAGRYTERTEQLVRLALSIADLLEEDEEVPAGVLDALSALAEDVGLAPPGVPSVALSPRVFERAALAQMRDAQHGTSVAWNLAALARAADAVRERMSAEHGRLVRAMGQDFMASMARLGEGPGTGFANPVLGEALDHLALQLAALTGAQTDRMTRDDGWRLLTVGRLIERLVGQALALRAFFAAPAARGEAAVGHRSGFDLLVALFDSSITYRARYPGREERLALLELLVDDESNPRALACVLRRLRTELAKLPAVAGPTDALLALLPAQGSGRTLEQLGRFDADGGFHVSDEQVVALADRLAAAGERLSDEVGRRYFAHAASELQHVFG
ncbi:circularly permuted type 2 ATP-grasp protein [Rivibacter subsaxonicus]|uniref:Putative circularly permuted ATP-grasp superfamily protein n=1 Tax=Rivibacter subsaxonicus TaxID=457575 RepID=A0A4Q7VNJ0_9BURK|nr:circularly permuted type 2 ATP-grasp protein [Rivibacter subsaxonicus]RZT97923.1 putative circularly permuted ATP-grasp superfamily protein [Rivibacter subsaxonicus]